MPSPFSLIEVFNAPALGFRGNTAAVVWLEKPLPDSSMQAIAADFNQPATTFLWPSARMHAFHVRWFAPDAEIGLCGHGSLAALVYLSGAQRLKGAATLLYAGGQIQGSMPAPDRYAIQLAAIPVLEEVPVPAAVQQGLGIPLQACFATSNKYILLAESEHDIQHMQPDFATLRQSDIFGYAVTAPGHEGVDFVSRTLVPHVQQLEDPATGSSHAALAPFWAARLGKKHLVAHQLSARGGRFICDVEEAGVKLSGSFSLFARGTLV